LDYIDCVVLGAGVVGLAIGKKISQEGLSCLVLDSMPTFGSVTSSRNNEVIHAGIYYPEGSLKSLLCVRGKKLLYEFCEKKSVPYRRCGKLIVSTSPDELDSIETIKMKAFANGVDD
jgi:L-2-hydroxyglutarate oxidase LhgO